MKYMPWLVIGIGIVALWDTSYRIDDRALERLLSNASWMVFFFVISIGIVFGLLLFAYIIMNMRARVIEKYGNDGEMAPEPRRRRQPAQLPMNEYGGTPMQQEPPQPVVNVMPGDAKSIW